MAECNEDHLAAKGKKHHNIKELMQKTKIHLAALGVAIIQLGALPANAYDLSTDYSTALNPSGVWSYGATETLGGAFTPFNSHYSAPGDNGVLIDVWAFGSFAPLIWHNGTANTVIGDGGQGIYPPGTVELLSGGNGVSYAFGVARFTAPQAGSYLLQTSVQNYLVGPSAADSDFHVLDNGAQLFAHQITASGGGSSAAYSTSLNLALGETIDFVVGRGLDGNGNFSGITIQASLTPVPEPTTLAFGGLGVAAVLVARRRR